jgi:hypothetical protein
MAEQLVRRPQIVEGLKSLRTLLLGGETLPVSLADYLSRTVRGDILNMSPSLSRVESRFPRDPGWQNIA